MSIFQKRPIERWKKKLVDLKVYAAAILDRALFSEKFRRPLNSKVTSLYGKRRVFNNKKDSWHSGIDFRARTPFRSQVQTEGRSFLPEIFSLMERPLSSIMDLVFSLCTVIFQRSKFKKERSFLKVILLGSQVTQDVLLRLICTGV